MIKISDGTIGAREFASIVVMTIGLKLSDTTPTFLFLSGGNAGWLLPLFSFLIFVVPFLVLLSVLKKHPGKGLMELVFDLTGKAGGMASSFAFFVIMLLTTIVNSRIYVDIVNTMVYQRTPIAALYIILIGAACFVASRGFEAIGRVAWIVIPYVYVIFILLFFFVWEYIDWLHLFPIAGPGVKTLAKEGLFHTSLYGEMFLLTAMIPLVRTDRKYRTASLIGFGLSVLNMIAATAVYIAVFDYPTVRELAYPFQQLTRAAQIGQVITHVESIFFFFWLICSVIHFAIYLHLTAYFFARIWGKNGFKQFIAPFSGLIVAMGLIPENNTIAVNIRGTLIEWLSLIYILFPLLLWGLDKRRRRKAA